MKNSKIIQDFTTGPVLRQLLSFSWPIICSNLMQIIYSMVDMAVVGHFVGQTGLSAVGIGSTITMVLLVACTGISNGGQTLLAQQIGAGDKIGISPIIGTLFSVLSICGIIFGAGCAASSFVILNLMNTPEESFSQAMGYTVICCAGLIFMYGYNAVSSILRGMGESRIPLLVIASASILNLILDLFFVAGLKMNAPGAALATILSQALSFVVTFLWLYRHRESFGFDFKLSSFSIRKKQLSAILKIGIPFVVQGLLITVSTAFVSARVNAYGITASAVDAIGQKLNNMLYIVAGAMALASAAMIAQCFGAGDFKRIRSIHNYSTAICMSVFVVISIILLIFPTGVFRIFSSENAVLDMAPDYMKIVIVFFLAASTMVSPYSLIEGIGHASLALIISLLDGFCARIIFGLILEKYLGVYGLWLGSSAAGFVTTIMSFIYYFSNHWTRRKTLL